MLCNITNNKPYLKTDCLKMVTFHYPILRSHELSHSVGYTVRKVKGENTLPNFQITLLI